jgi:hypothetical protein
MQDTAMVLRKPEDRPLPVVTNRDDQPVAVPRPAPPRNKITKSGWSIGLVGIRRKPRLTFLNCHPECSHAPVCYRINSPWLMTISLKVNDAPQTRMLTPPHSC